MAFIKSFSQKRPCVEEKKGEGAPKIDDIGGKSDEKEGKGENE